MPDCVEGLTDGYRGWDETILLWFASLLLLPRATKGLNRVVNSLTCWLSDSALNIDENQLSLPFTLAPGVTDSLVRCARETSSHPWRAVQSLQGFLSLAPLLRLQTRGPINANCGTFSEVDRCPLGTEHSPSPCRRYGSVWDLTSCLLEKKWYFCCGQEVG